jgi:hypothetical protein
MYFRLNLLSFAASVTFTRFFLMATGYPQLGNETLHIAHVLYGGVVLYVGSLIPLIYANRWAYTWSSILSGVGIGLFIDEVGKFITQSNDYFFPAAAPIIYAFFLTSVLVYTRLVKETPLDTRTEFYAVLESLEEAIDHDMDPDEHKELRRRLERIKEKTGISGFEGRWLSRSRLKAFIIGGVLLLGLGGLIRLMYYTIWNPGLLESILQERVADLPVVTSMSMFWAFVQLVMEGLVGLILLFSAALLIFEKEKRGLGFGSIGLVVSLVGVNLIQFYIDQFSTVTKAFFQFLILQAIYYYQRRFRIK